LRLPLLSLLLLPACALAGRLAFPTLPHRYALACAVAYAALSAACVALYAADKSAAVAGRRRIPESTLLLCGLAGGWPGALLAQRLLSHKTRKQAFQHKFWGTVVANIGLLGATSSALYWLPGWR
jgi:uncharacterized membrane protein YsdA (DUF1294 family)